MQINSYSEMLTLKWCFLILINVFFFAKQLEGVCILKANRTPFITTNSYGTTSHIVTTTVHVTTNFNAITSMTRTTTKTINANLYFIVNFKKVLNSTASQYLLPLQQPNSYGTSNISVFNICASNCYFSNCTYFQVTNGNNCFLYKFQNMPNFIKNVLPEGQYLTDDDSSTCGIRCSSVGVAC